MVISRARHTLSPFGNSLEIPLDDFTLTTNFSNHATFPFMEMNSLSSRPFSWPRDFIIPLLCSV